MSELLSGILKAHGGMARWNRYEKVAATIVSAPASSRSTACPTLTES